MELKNALAVCLISLFSATLVVLIARSLDSQAASRLEPQLAKIAQELQVLRTGGSLTVSSTAQGPGESLREGLIVYYFHGNIRCPTCEAIEGQALAAVQAHFDAELTSGVMAWQTLNYEESSASELARKFGIQMPVVVLARMTGGEIADWKRLDEVWGLVGDKPAFTEFVREEIRAMLPSRNTGAEAAQSDPSAANSESASRTDGEPAAAVPGDIPLPR
jgi:hypothetical protein